MTGFAAKKPTPRPTSPFRPKRKVYHIVTKLPLKITRKPHVTDETALTVKIETFYCLCHAANSGGIQGKVVVPFGKCYNADII
jgi:hypothetical protein